MFSDTREPLVEAALQVLCVTLDNEPSVTAGDPNNGPPIGEQQAVDVNIYLNF